MKDSFGMVHKDEWLEPDKARRTLVVQQYPAGSNAMKADYLEDVATNWHDEICTGKLEPTDSWNDLNARVITTMDYPLFMTIFTSYECQAIF